MATGPRTTDTLDRNRVVAEALRLIDEEGFTRLTMRNLASRLRVVPMAIYRHVADKDDLIDAVFDLALNTIAVPDTDLGWREGLRTLTVRLRDLLLEHPALAVEVAGRPTLGPASLHIAEYGYAVTRTAGFSDEDAVSAVNTLVVYVIGFAALAASRRPEDVARLQKEYDALPPDVFTHTLAVQPRVEDLVSEKQFSDGLEMLLDGLAKRLD